MNADRVCSRVGTNAAEEMIRRSGGSTASIGSEIWPLGSLTAPPGRAEVTTAVGTEVAPPLDPYWLAAVTETRIRCPTSAELSRCVDPDPSESQLLPALSQRDQRD